MGSKGEELHGLWHTALVSCDSPIITITLSILTSASLSEYGCNTNKREFKEVASLYSTDMTSVYSGGLVYEYVEEGSKYGLVKINGDSVEELDDFDALKTAFAGTPNPQGDGGYSQSGAASKCPAKSSTFDVDTAALPAIPEPAKKFMNQGAGTGVGLGGSGSQNAGTGSSGTATAGSGSVTATGTPKKGAAGALHAPALSVTPVICGLVVIASSLLGAALL